jgi:two-component system cell cycle sensor histidine kinase/response regulator CckA
MALGTLAPKGLELGELFRSLYMHMAEGVALHAVVCDEAGRPVNYRILDVNPQYERYTGLAPSAVIGKLATEAYGVTTAPYLAEFSEVGMTGVPRRLETYFPPLDRHYEISIAPMGKGHFATIFLDVSERRRQEKALAESEWFLQRSQLVGQIGSYRLDVATATWRSSKGLDEVFGIDASFHRDLDGWLSLVHPEDREGMNRYLAEEVLAKGQPFERRYRIVRARDGQVRWVEGRGELELGPDGKPVSMIGTIQDIHERMLRDLALQEKTDELDRFFRLNIDLLCIADDAGRFLRLNQAWEAILGWPLSELEGKEFLNFVHPEDRPATMRVMEALRTDREVVDFVNRYQCRDGSYRFIEWRTAPSNNGRLYAAARDVTERIHYEDSLREGEERFRRIFEMSPEPLLLTELNGRPLNCNDAFSATTGYPLAELLNLEGGTVPLWEDPKRREEYSALLERQGAVDRFEFKMRRRDGRTRTIQLSSRMFELSNRRVVLAVSRDITEHRNLEQQMLHTQKLESLGVLAGGIAHDFNNLLTGILGNADLAKEDISPVAPARTSLHGIEVAARRAADLCRQLLAYSGRGRFLIQPIDLQDLVQEMGHLLSVSISKKVVLKFHFSQGLPAIEADATQLRQVVMNLIVNASEAIGERSGVISITTGLAYCDAAYLHGCFTSDGIAEGDFVYLEIADTGDGMDKATLDRIFDPFFTTKFTGRGLGLAAVLGIVRGHKGAIKVYSEKRRGSTFKLLFPACETAAIPLSPSQSPQATYRGKGLVLLADDEETIRNLGRRMLQRWGFEVLVAADGREAVEMFRAAKDKIILVILDLTMPHLDGEACYRELRQIHPDVRVILSSGYNEQDVVNRFAGKGLAGFVQKPYSSEELMAKVRVALDDEPGDVQP